MTEDVIGDSGYEQAQHGGLVRLLSPTAKEVASAGNVIGGAGNEHAQHGGQDRLL